jgi:hypothetical protein
MKAFIHQKLPVDVYPVGWYSSAQYVHDYLRYRHYYYEHYPDRFAGAVACKWS